jgi:hypothetical protein
LLHGLGVLERRLAARSYVAGGAAPSAEDDAVAGLLAKAGVTDGWRALAGLGNVARWLRHVSALGGRARGVAAHAGAADLGRGGRPRVATLRQRWLTFGFRSVTYCSVFFQPIESFRSFMIHFPSLSSKRQMQHRMAKPRALFRNLKSRARSGPLRSGFGE